MSKAKAMRYSSMITKSHGTLAKRKQREGQRVQQKPRLTFLDRADSKTGQNLLSE
jgi:hypothetical protein